MDTIYPWLKAAHVAAALVFVGGVLGLSVFLSAAKREGAAADLASAVRRWDGRITTPAMLLVWALGLTLATTGNWFSQPWLQTKLLVVVALSAIHGVQSGRLRRLARADTKAGGLSPYLVIACATTIAVLAVVKPF